MNNISILIGNGFNHALNIVDNTLNVELDYQSIIARISEKLKADLTAYNIISHFIKKGEFDVERLLNNLYFISEFSGVFKNTMLGGIQEDQFENLILEAGRIHDLVQKCFIEAIGENHPIYKSILCGDKLKVVCGNLANFKKIFTINFDLILYWLIMDMNKKGLGFQYKDKFNVNCGKYANMFDVNIKAFHEWNFMYLHGGIHLLKNIEDSDVLKLKNNNKFGNILEMYNKMKKKSKYESHLVFGKTSADKRSIIANSPYLTMAMNQLKNHDGELIVYGCKPCIDNDFNDQHLWENIIYSNIKKLYLGLVSKKDEEKTKKYIECRNSKIEISFFDIVEINIWRDVGFIDAIIA